MPMSGPTNLCPSADNVREHMLRYIRVIRVKEGVHLLIRGILNSQCFLQESSSVFPLLRKAFTLGKVIFQVGLDKLARVTGIGEHTRVP